MKKIKRLSLFIGLLTVPFLAVACESENHYKYDGNGEHSYVYTYTMPSGYTMPTSDRSSYSFSQTNPIVNNNVKNLPPMKVFDCYNDGYRLTSPIIFSANEYTPNTFIVDTEMNIIQKETNYYFGKAYALYLYDADLDGYRDFCMGFSEGEGTNTNDVVCIFSPARNKEIYYLSETGLLNNGDYHFYGDFAYSSTLYLHKDTINAAFERTTLDEGRLSINAYDEVTIVWQNVSLPANLSTGTMRTGQDTFVSPVSNMNSVHEYNVNRSNVYVVDLGTTSNIVRPIHEYFSISHRSSNHFVKSLYYTESGKHLYLYLAFDQKNEVEAEYDIEIRIGKVSTYYKFNVDSSTIPITLSRVAFGATYTPSYLVSYLSSVQYSHENYPFRDIYEWNERSDLTKFCNLCLYGMYPLANKYYPSSPDAEEIKFNGAVFGTIGLKLDDKQFISYMGYYYVLEQPFDFLERESSATKWLGFTSMTDIIARKISNPSTMIEIENASDIRFQRVDNASNYRKQDANFSITIGENTFYVIDNRFFIDESEENLYYIVTYEDLSILFN